MTTTNTICGRAIKGRWMRCTLPAGHRGGHGSVSARRGKDKQPRCPRCRDYHAKTISCEQLAELRGAEASAYESGALWGRATRPDGATVPVTVPEDDRTVEVLHAAGRAVLDAFGLDDKSGFTPEQRKALALLERAVRATGGLS